MSYDEWIAAHYPDRLTAIGMCGAAARKMAAEFPELRVVPGWVTPPNNFREEHVWCVTPAGEIVDPTRCQYPPGRLTYTPWKPGDVVKVGRCMNCGDDIFRAVEMLDGPRLSICSDDCSEEFARYISSR